MLNRKISWLTIFATLIFIHNVIWSQIPFVYNVENTGDSFPKPVLPAFADLPTITPLTDPFQWSDGNGRINGFSDWSQRRAEIAEEIQYYEIGPKPPKPDTITATFNNDTLKVFITKNGQTLILTSKVTIPEGTGPFPAIIGIGAGTGSLPSVLFTNRKIITIPFNFGQVMAHTQTRGSEPINKLYPDLTYIGAYSAWSWGISRLIDGIELVKDSLKIDMSHIGITGCSFAGKMALFGGAFDERIALTIAQEPGGGGAAAWRVSAALPTNVETIANTNYAWFLQSFSKFAGKEAKLPYDHHELMAMVAPRALLVLGNPDYEWLAEESGFVSCMAAKKVWEAFGIEDRFGFSIVGNHGHCALPISQYPEVEAFIDKFLLGIDTVNTLVRKASYPYTDYEKWTNWWGTEDPIFPTREAYYFEPECATVGNHWTIQKVNAFSKEAYVKVKTGNENLLEAPTDSASKIFVNFHANTDTNYYLFLRVKLLKDTSNAIWIKLNNETFTKWQGKTSSDFIWQMIGSYNLKEGEHTLTLANCEDGVMIDKICISPFPYLPEKKGDTAINYCEIQVNINKQNTQAFELKQNYPNPANKLTTFEFSLPHESNVTLKIYNTLGSMVKLIVNKSFAKGNHSIIADVSELSDGVYYYTLETDKYVKSKILVIKK